MSENQGILRIEYLLYAVVLVLLAPYAGCHILSSPPDDTTELSLPNETTSDTTSIFDKTEESATSSSSSDSEATQDELAEIRELLS